MPRYAAFLRGVSPMNARMPQLKRAFEAAGCGCVRTVLSSGNVVFTADKAAVSRIQAEAQAFMERHLGRSFPAFVRPVNGLRRLLELDPYRGIALPAGSKRIVTFLRDPPSKALRFPIEKDGATILGVRGGAAFGAYLPGPDGAKFMALLERTFGKAITTRTWETLERVTAAGEAL